MAFSKKWYLWLMPAILGSFALTTSFISSFWCQSVQFPGDSSTIHFGPWMQSASKHTSLVVGGETYYFLSSTCAAFPSGMIDAKIRAVRAFSVLAALVGGFLLVPLWLGPCFYAFSDSSWRCVAVTFIVLVTPFQGLTFLIFSSSFCQDNTMIGSTGMSSSCEWDQGSTANVISVVLWFLTGLTMLKLGAPKRPPREPAETQTVTYQKTELPGGGAQVAEVAVVKGTAVPTPPKPEESAA